MNDNQSKREWTPPSRPDWVAKVNAEEACMDIRDVIPLDENSLLKSAMRKTGLSDFGSDEWLPHFRFILNAMEEEADFNLMGRITARAHLLNILEGRLQIEDTFKKYPEIHDEEIKQPIFIVGQGRSGTSILQNILSSDPHNKELTCWEAMFPVPPPDAATYETDSRIELTDKFIQQWVRINPATGSVHEWTGKIPVECVQILSYSFLSQWFILLGQITSYVDYMLAADWRPAYAYHKKVLKLLQWKNPKDHWLLKSPTHMPNLPLLLETYPDAMLVWPHRDPVKAVASVVSLAGNRNWVTSDRPRITGYEQYTDPLRVAAMLERVIDWQEDGRIPKESICHVHYRDIVEKPLETAEYIYAYFGRELTPEGRSGMETYVKANPRDARPEHQYSVGTSEIIDRERKIFKRYTEYFHIPLET